MSAGMLLFVDNQIEAAIQTVFNEMNSAGRVSPEVLSLHLATPSRSAVRDAANKLKTHPDLQGVERLHRLKPNNAVRDLTAPWRLHPEFVNAYKLVLNLETVNPEFRHKYPDPNLTLPAGGIDAGEHPLHAAHRELFEEARIKVDPRLVCGYIGLFKNGMHMYCVVITPHTPTLFSQDDNTLYIGDMHHIREFYEILGRPSTSPNSRVPHYLNLWHNTQTCGAFSKRQPCYDSRVHGTSRLESRYHPTYRKHLMKKRESLKLAHSTPQ